MASRSVFIRTLLDRHRVFQITGIAVAIVATFTFVVLSQRRQHLRSNASTTIEIEFDGSSYTPQTVTIEQGDTIRWTNVSATEYTQISSDPHPVHTDYPPLNIGLLAPNDSVTLVMNDIGTYGYHDHLLPSTTGTIIVEEAQTSTPLPTVTDEPTYTPSPAIATHTLTPSITNTKTPTPRPTLTNTPFETYEEFVKRITIVPRDTYTPIPTATPFVTQIPTESEKSIVLQLVVGAAGFTILVISTLFYIWKKRIQKTTLPKKI